MTDNQSFLQALEKEFNSRFDKDFIELESKAPHSFSKKHNKQMEKLIKRQQKPYFRLISTTGRRVACSIVIFVVFGYFKYFISLGIKCESDPRALF